MTRKDICDKIMNDYSFNKRGGFVMDKKAVIITGGSSGMGKAMAKKQAELGWHVMVTGRNHEALEETKKKLRPLRAGRLFSNGCPF